MSPKPPEKTGPAPRLAPREWAAQLNFKRGVAGAISRQGWTRETLVTEEEFRAAVEAYLRSRVDGGS